MVVDALWEGCASWQEVQTQTELAPHKLQKERIVNLKALQHIYGAGLDECGPAFEKFKRKINTQKLACSLPSSRRNTLQHYIESLFFIPPRFLFFHALTSQHYFISGLKIYLACCIIGECTIASEPCARANSVGSQGVCEHTD